MPKNGKLKAIPISRVADSRKVLILDTVELEAVLAHAALRAAPIRDAVFAC
jgi:hypothetical protein